MALPSSADHISLTQVLESCSKPDNFVAIEAPLNLFEREVVVANEGKTISDIAKVTNLGKCQERRVGYYNSDLKIKKKQVEQ